MLLYTCFVVLPYLLGSALAASPSLIFHVIVDDLGWGDTTWHGATDPGVQTPHMAGLVAEGVQLDRVYVYHMCTPSRSSFLSGRLPVHVEVALPNPENPNQGVPRNMTSIARKLKAQGYQTHVVGSESPPTHTPAHPYARASHAPHPPPTHTPTHPAHKTEWDLGMATHDHTPKGRGFDSSLIYFEHKVDYWDQSLAQSSCMNYNATIIDLWSHAPAEEEGPARALNGTAYVEYLFRDRVLSIIEQHDPALGPLYLQYDPHIAHCPLQVPQDWLARFSAGNDEAVCQAQTARIFPGSGPKDYRCRNQYHAMVALLDEVLGNITAAIKAKGWWDSTLMVLHSDNGGPVDLTESGSNNWPLRCVGGRAQVVAAPSPPPFSLRPDTAPPLTHPHPHPTRTHARTHTPPTPPTPGAASTASSRAAFAPMPLPAGATFRLPCAAR